MASDFSLKANARLTSRRGCSTFPSLSQPISTFINPSQPFSALLSLYSAFLSPSQPFSAFLSLRRSFSAFLRFHPTCLMSYQPLGPSQPFSILLSLSRPSLSPSPPYSVILFLSQQKIRPKLQKIMNISRANTQRGSTPQVNVPRNISRDSRK